MLRVIELVRVSTAGQAAEDRASIPSQKAINRKTAQAFGLTIVRTIELADVSGTQVLLTPEIQDMIVLMRDAEIHGVVAREFSRLMRPENFLDYAFLQAFYETNTILYLPEGPIDFSSKTGRLMGTIRAAMAGMERTEILERMWAAKEQKRREGGFSQSKKCLPLGVDYTDRWRFNNDAERVREAFRLLLAGDTSYSSIGKKVDIEPFNLRNIFRNPIYTGWRVVDKRRDPSPKAKRPGKDGRQGDRPKIKRAPEDIIRVKVIDEPLISESQFNQVQRILDLKRANHWRTKPNVVHRFTYNGYLRCVCQRLVYTKFRRDDYYICSGRCGVHYMRRDKLEPQIDSLFAERLARPRFLQEIIKGTKKTVPQADIQKLNDQLIALEAKRNRILDAYFEGVITAVERDVRTCATDKESQIVRSLIAKQKPRPEVDVETLADLFAPFAEFDMLNREDKRQLLNTITPKITVANYQIEGMWIGVERSDDLRHTGVDSIENESESIYIPLRVAA